MKFDQGFAMLGALATISFLLSGCGGGGGSGSVPFKFVSQSFACDKGTMTVDNEKISAKVETLMLSFDLDMTEGELKIRASSKSAVNFTVPGFPENVEETGSDAIYDGTGKAFYYHALDEQQNGSTGKIQKVDRCAKFALNKTVTEVQDCLSKAADAMNKDGNTVTASSVTQTITSQDNKSTLELTRSRKFEVDDANIIKKVINQMEMPSPPPASSEKGAFEKTTIIGTLEATKSNAGVPPTEVFTVPASWGECEPTEPDQMGPFGFAFMKNSQPLPAAIFDCLGFPEVKSPSVSMFAVHEDMPRKVMV